MAETLHLRILTPQREVLDTSVDAVTAQGALGQFGVLPRHITFLTSLEPGALSFPGGTIAVKGGYAEVRDDAVTILADEAVRVEDLDRGDSERALVEAERVLEETPFGHPEHERARRELRWAEVRVALAR